MANQLERTSKPHALTLATLERALRARRLDHTLTSALPPLERTDPSVLAATDIAALDACLQPAAPAQTIAHVRLEKSALGAPGVDGGLPRGQLSEIVGPRSSGRTLLLHQVMAAATRRGELAALVDTLDQFDVGSAVSAGVDLDRLLWIRGQTISNQLLRQATELRRHGEDVDCSPPCLRVWAPPAVARCGGMERALDRALKALTLVLQAGGFGVVALDLADVPITALTRLPVATWLRVQRTIEGGDTACVLVAAQPLARSARGVTLAVAGRTQWGSGIGDQGSGLGSRLVGLDVTVRVVSPRRQAGGDVSVLATTGDSRGSRATDSCSPCPRVPVAR